jgi:transcriptional regulator with XRE-family HTH domain
MRQPAARAACQEARVAFEIGSQVRELREARGLSQRQLAERMGTTQSTVARLEAGGTRPTLTTLERVASALNATVKFEFERSEPVAS